MARRKVAKKRTVITRFKKKRQVFKVAKNKLVLIPVCVYHQTDSRVPCHVGDLVEFINCSGKKTVTIHFGVSPFIPGNPPQTIVVKDIPVICQVVGPIGTYPSESNASGMSSGGPDGPAVVVQ